MFRDYMLEKDFIECGFRCVIIGTYMGHRCGYLAIPQGHELYGKHYDDIDVEVHGGLTFSAESDTNEIYYPAKTNEKVWWIGFDCAHFGDGKDYTLIENIIARIDDEEAKQDALNTYHMIRRIEERYPDGFEPRTTEYVENELRDLARQIANAKYLSYQDDNSKYLPEAQAESYEENK